MDEHLYRLLFSEMAGGFAVLDMVYDNTGRAVDCRFLDINETIEQSLGVKRSEVLGKTIREVAPDIEQYWVDAMADVAESGAPAQFENYAKQFNSYFSVNAISPKKGMVAALFLDITSHKKMQIELEETSERFHLAMRGANDGLWDWNLIDNSIYYSPRWKSILGYEDNELENEFSVWENLVHPEDRDKAWSMFEDYVNDVIDLFNIEFRMKHKDGHWVDVLSRAFMVKDEKTHKPLRLIGTHTDISELKRIQRELTEAKEAAESADKAKSRFLANVSHEVRTPLNGILGIAQLLQDTRLSQEQREMLNLLQQSGKHLFHIVEDLLDLSSIEFGKISLQMTTFDLEELIRSTLFFFKAQTEEKKITINTSISAACKKIYGDKKRISQILINLLSNAFKYTEKGTIRIQASIRDESLKLEISDTGIGISKENRESIFENFYQGEHPFIKTQAGLGIGLYVTRQLVDLMEGTIQMESEEGLGTSFTITLPIPEGKEEIPEEVQEITARQHSGSILVVEDEYINSFYIKTLLEKKGFSADHAGDGEEALSLFVPGKYTCVLLDIGLPGKDGYSVIKEFRDKEDRDTGKPTPVIALTAHAFPADRERCLAAGFDGFLSKPVSEKELLQTIDSLSSSSPQRQ